MKNGQNNFRHAEWLCSENFIKHDGAFARAICAYERYLDSIHQ